LSDLCKAVRQAAGREAGTGSDLFRNGWREKRVLLRAVVVGFVLGFALVGVFRLSESEAERAQLTSAQALHRGAAIDHVADEPCLHDRRPVLVLI
jgi:hypothetical protein